MNYTWPPSEQDVDKALLLIARGASREIAGQEFGVPSRKLQAYLRTSYPDAYASAIEARPHLADNHGSSTRYEYMGCRCVVCREGNADRARQRREAAPAPPEVVKSYQDAYLEKHREGCGCGACVRARGRKRLSQRRKQRESTSTIRRGREHQWTGAELELVLERDESGEYVRSPTEAAAAVGRSYYAVAHVRRRESLPSVGRIAGV